MERITNGVGLHHVAHKAEGKDQSNGEENGQELAKLALECRADVIHRAAGHLAVHRGAVGLGQNGFGVNGSHAEKGRNPGPEQCAGAAADQGGGAAGNVATEDTLNMMHEMGIETGIDNDALHEAVLLLQQYVHAPIVSHLMSLYKTKPCV